MKKFFILIVLCSVLVSLFGCGADHNTPSIPVVENPTITLTTCYAGSEIDICTPELREYLNAQTEAEQAAVLLRYSGGNCSYQACQFRWEGDGSETYTVYFADNMAFENATTVTTTNQQLVNYGTFIPGTTYFWKVVGDLEGSNSIIDYFTIVDAPIRPIETESILNTRDIGGWKTESGKTVQYGMIYRCARTNRVGDNQCADGDVTLFRDVLGVATEIDLRGADAYKQSMSVFGEDILYVRAPISAYSCIIPEFAQTEPVYATFDGGTPWSIKSIFEVLGQEENYPVVFHCNAGADRTGTLAFLINGVLGVSYEDLTRDFEVTSFGGSTRWRSDITDSQTFADYGIQLSDDSNYIAWDQMYRLMLEHYGTEDGTLKSAIENYLINACDVAKSDIETLQTIMLKQGE